MSDENTTETVAEPLADNGIDRIRQMLFGEQIAETERRFKRLEEQLADESAQLPRDLTERLEEMAGQLRKDIQIISTELEDDSKERAELSELFANISLSLRGKLQDQNLG